MPYILTKIYAFARLECVTDLFFRWRQQHFLFYCFKKNLWHDEHLRFTSIWMCFGSTKNRNVIRFKWKSWFFPQRNSKRYVWSSAEVLNAEKCIFHRILHRVRLSWKWKQFQFLLSFAIETTTVQFSHQIY